MVSGSGSNTEEASHFVDHHSKHIPSMLPSHIQDTPGYLREVDKENEKGPQPEDSFPVTLDIEGLYPNIPQEEGLKAFEEKISDREFRPDQLIPTSFLMTLLTYVLTFNIFIFNGVFYIQQWGTAIGTRIAPTYANIFCGWLEEKLLASWSGSAPSFWRRFIDDIIFWWRSDEEELIEFLTFLNSSHPTIKFTGLWRIDNMEVKASW